MSNKIKEPLYKLSIEPTKKGFEIWQPDNNGGSDLVGVIYNENSESEFLAQYTALAVNNLHHLADCLEWIRKEITSTPDELREALDGLILIKIEKALNPIN